MTAIGELNVVPIREESMSEEIAKAVDALEAFDVAYRERRREPTTLVLSLTHTSESRESGVSEALEAGEHELRPTGRETRSALGTERSTRVDCVRIHNYGFHPAKGAEYWYLDRHSPVDCSQTGSATCG